MRHTTTTRTRERAVPDTLATLDALMDALREDAANELYDDMVRTATPDERTTAADDGSACVERWADGKDCRGCKHAASCKG